MFSLLISLVALALVLLLSAATLYYLGGAVTADPSGSAGLQNPSLVVLTTLDEVQQIRTALMLMRASEPATGPGAPVVLGDIAPLYLQQIPAGWDAATPLAQGFVDTRLPLPAKACARMNASLGLTAGSVSPATAEFGCIDAPGAEGFGHAFVYFGS